MRSTEERLAERSASEPAPGQRDDRTDRGADTSGSAGRSRSTTSSKRRPAPPNGDASDELPTEPVPVTNDDVGRSASDERRDESPSAGVSGDPLLAPPTPPATVAGSAKSASERSGPAPDRAAPLEPPSTAPAAPTETIPEVASPPTERILDDRSSPTRRPILGRRATVIDAERHLIAPVQRVIGRRPRVRRVTRVVRHVDPWTMFKVSAVFSLVLYGVLLVSGVLLWNVAHTTGTVENIERWMESFGWESFEFNGGQIYRAAWVGGLFGVIGLTGLAVLMATLFNLITDLVGGVRFTVLEEEVREKTTSPMKRFTVRHTDDSSEITRAIRPGDDADTSEPSGIVRPADRGRRIDPDAGDA